jgi:predicted LPLAT superfamily acyltransferase
MFHARSLPKKQQFVYRAAVPSHGRCIHFHAALYIALVSFLLTMAFSSQASRKWYSLVSKRTRVPHGELGVPYDAFGVFGATPPEKIGVLHSSSLKTAPISPNTS